MIARTLTLIAVMFAAGTACGQSTLPEGTFLPVALDSSIDSKKVHPGQEIKARIMQDVPLRNGSQIPTGTRILGHITALPSAGGRSSVSLRFDRLNLHHEDITIVTSLRAMASFVAVHDAQIPLFGSDRGTAENSWTTLQVGGDDVVYRGGGPVVSRLGKVGVPVPGGVLVRPRTLPGTPCASELNNDNQLQAFWVFSSDACGVNRLPNLTICHTGRTRPVGEVTLVSSKNRVKLSTGTGLLLRVLDPATP